MVLDHWKTKLYPMIMAKEQCTPHMFLQCQVSKNKRNMELTIFKFILTSLLCIWRELNNTSQLLSNRPSSGFTHFCA